MINSQIPLNEYVPVNIFKTICGGVSQPSMHKRPKLELSEIGQDKSGNNKEYGNLLTFKRSKIKYISECKFLVGVLLSSGQLVIFKTKFNKNSISTTKVFKESYVNNLILEDRKMSSKEYPTCYSFDISKEFRIGSHKGRMYVIVQFNSGIYLLELTKNPIKLSVTSKIIESIPETICAKCKLTKEHIHILFGTYNGHVFYYYALLNKLEQLYKSVNIKISNIRTMIQEPIIEIKITHEKDNGLSTLISKGRSLIKYKIESTSLIFDKLYDFTENSDSIYGFTKNYDQVVYSCGLEGNIYCLDMTTGHTTKFPLNLIKEAYGIRKSSNGILLYVVGKGKLEKEIKPLIEIINPLDYKPQEIICRLLSNFN